MASVALNVERLLDDLAHLALFGAIESGGLNRPAFSPAWVEASRWLLQRMTDAGLAARIDAAGNVIGRLGPSEGPALVCGSHIDTVPGGGAFDGALGVIAGLECARAFAESNAGIQLALEIVAFADEEGAYISMLGSRAMTCGVPAEELDSASGRSGDDLAGAMRRAGLDTGLLHCAIRPQKSFAYYLELHIEQGPVLAAKALDVGIVDSIVGVDVTEYLLEGQARHAGTTPMAERRDAGRAACEAIASVFAGDFHRSAPEARITFGALQFDPGASNVIPGSSRTVSEVRAARASDIRQVRNNVDNAFDLSAVRHGLRVQRRHLGSDPPSHMAPDIIELIADVCTASNRNFTLMPSGASHDASNFSRLVPTGMIFIASRDGISHHPDEYSASASIIVGAEILLHAIQRLICV